MATPRRVQAGQSVQANTSNNTFSGTGYVQSGTATLPYNPNGYSGNTLTLPYISTGISTITPSPVKIGHLKINKSERDGDDGVSRVSIISENDPTTEYRHVSSSPNIVLIIHRSLDNETSETLVKEQLMAIICEGIYTFNKKTPKPVINKLLRIAALSKIEKAWLYSELVRVGWSKGGTSNTTP